MNERLIDKGVLFIADDEVAEIAESADGALDDPTAPIAPEFLSILPRWLLRCGQISS